MSRPKKHFDFDISRNGKHYVPHEKEYIVKAYEMGYPVYDIAEAVKRSPEGVRDVIKDAGYRRIVMAENISPGRVWTEREDEYLRDNINLITWDDMSFELGRTVFAVKARAHDLGLRKRSEYDGPEQE